MTEHQIIFNESINQKYLYIKVKAILMAMGVPLPASVNVVTPDKISRLEVTYSAAPPNAPPKCPQIDQLRPECS